MPVETTLEPGLHEKNRLSWNAATVAHNQRKSAQASFLREGGSTLFAEEVELLGDLSGKSVLHLLCNSGQDTLCIARSAASTTGVDISDEAIAFARRLSEDSGIRASFARSDVYDWLEQAATESRRFDVVFLSYGAIIWLSDLREFMRRVSRVLEEHGRLIVVDFHPTAMMYDEYGTRKYDYFDEEPVVTSGVPDYVTGAEGALSPSGTVPGDGEVFMNQHPDYTFQFGIGQLVMACIDAGLDLRVLNEYPYSNGVKQFSDMVQDDRRRWHFPEGQPSMPLMFGLIARRSGSPS